MLIFIMLGGIGFFYALTTSINDGLPRYISRVPMGIVDGLYRIIRGIGFICIFLTLDFIVVLLGLLLLGIAWLIRKVAWKSLYGDLL